MANRKKIAVTLALITTPIGIGAIQWGSQSSQRTHALVSGAQLEISEMRETIERLETELRDSERQLGESLDMLEQGMKQQLRRHRNCAPARESLVYYQWLDANEHKELAANDLDHWVQTLGNGSQRTRHLNRYAWSLMTERKTAGKFDRAALALVERAAASTTELDANTLDTLALAKFLDGQLERACEVQKRAVQRESRDDELRRRLRMYEAARDAAAVRVALALPQGGKAVKPDALALAAANAESEAAGAEAPTKED